MMELWPFTNFHDMNLDWIISHIKKVFESEQSASNSAEAAAASATSAANSADQAEEYSNIAIAYGAKYFRTPEMHGAEGDGITDDSAAVLAAFEYCKQNPENILLLANNYYTPGLQLEWDTSNVNILINGYISEMRGIFPSNRRTSAWIQGSEIGNCEILGAKGLYMCVSKIADFKLIATQYVTGSESCAYNSFHGTRWDNITLRCVGLSSWNNENKFHDMDCKNLILDSDDYGMNNNRFYDIVLENSPITFKNARNNYIKVRGESLGTITETNSKDNKIVRTFQSVSMSDYATDLDQDTKQWKNFEFSELMSFTNLVNDNINTVYHNDNNYTTGKIGVPSWSDLHTIRIPMTTQGLLLIKSNVNVFRLKVWLEDLNRNNITTGTENTDIFRLSGATYDSANQVYNIATDSASRFIGFTAEPSKILCVTIATGPVNTYPHYITASLGTNGWSIPSVQTLGGTLMSATSTPTNTNAPLGTIVQDRTGNTKGWTLTSSGWTVL